MRQVADGSSEGEPVELHDHSGGRFIDVNFMTVLQTSPRSYLNASQVTQIRRRWELGGWTAALLGIWQLEVQHAKREP